jgi:hypothetical protein
MFLDLKHNYHGGTTVQTKHRQVKPLRWWSIAAIRVAVGMAIAVAVCCG